MTDAERLESNKEKLQDAKRRVNKIFESSYITYDEIIDELRVVREELNYLTRHPRGW